MSLDAFPADAYGAALCGADYGEAFLEEKSWTSARLEDGRVEEAASGSDRGLGLRLLKRGPKGVESFFASGPDLGPEAAARLRLGLLAPSGAPPRFSPAVARRVAAREDPVAVPLARKAELLRALDRAVRAEFPGVRQVTLSYADKTKSTRTLNTDGADARQTLVSVVLSASVVAEEGGRLQTGHETLGAQGGFELVAGDAPFAAARRAAARALAKLRAPKAKAGEMPVVLSSSAGGTFIHEALGHSLEVDHVQEGSSPAYRGAVGRAVAAPKITVIDDPTLPFQRGSFFFDDEGVPAAPTRLVEGGILRGYLYDRACALREGRASNGHGRRESFENRPVPRMSNLYIAPGPDDPDKIVRSLERGLLVTRMGGGQVNTATGEFVFEVDEGFWVEGGKVRRLVRDANLLGIGPDALMSIDRVGWDVGWGIGTCGKEEQNVPVSDGQPTIRLPSVVVGGTHED
ncbi:MAG: TldD/PmbA family protein [Elusimicrobia bacterium]|nr:TldD/PmbA family protein [Elusimicrobiota bacterium]